MGSLAQVLMMLVQVGVCQPATLTVQDGSRVHALVCAPQPVEQEPEQDDQEEAPKPLPPGPRKDT